MAYYKNNKDTRQQVKELTDQLEQGVRNVFESERYADYLRVMSRFPRYSVRNTILISMQRPDATLVAGYMAWQNNFGRYVNRGEQAIKILAPVTHREKRERTKVDPDTRQPMLDEHGRPIKEEVEVTIPSFKVASIFDVNQTSGRPLPTLVDDIEGSVNGYRDFTEAVRRVSPVPIRFEEMEGKDGYYHQVEQRIAINDDLSERQTMAAMIHELSHAKLHALDPANLKESAKVRGKDKQTMEIEAESISFVVNSHFGIDTSENSWGYVASWSRNKELPELHASLQVIKDTAVDIIENIELELAEIRHVYVSKEEALEAFDEGEAIFEMPERGRVFSVNRADIASAPEDAFFRVPRESWKHYKEVQAEKDLVPAVTSIKEATLLLMPENRFGIYQINDETKGREYEFMSHEFVEQQNYSIERGDYNLLYVADLTSEETLDSLYEKFNLNRPEDFTGHSLSVSDIVVLNWDGKIEAFYVDSFGFTEVPEFLTNLLMPDQTLEEAVFKIADRYIEIHQSDGGYDYSIYDMDYRLLDGGLYESDIGIIPAVKDLATDLKEPVFNTVTEQYERNDVQGEVSPGDRLFRLQDSEYETFMEKVEEANRIEVPVQPENEKEDKSKTYQPLRKVEELKEQNYNLIDEILNNGFGDEEKREVLRQSAEQYRQATNASLTYYAAACEEFPSLGPFYESASFDEIVARYKEILADPRLTLMGNGIGIVLHDPTLPDYSDSELLLVRGKSILGSNLDLVEPFLIHPLVQEALIEFREAFPSYEYEPPMSVLKAVYPENMTAQELAASLISLAGDFDLYDLRDRADDPAHLQEEVETRLLEGKGMEYAPFLNDVAAESPMLRFQAEILQERIRAFHPEPQKEVKAEQDRKEEKAPAVEVIDIPVLEKAPEKTKKEKTTKPKTAKEASSGRKSEKKPSIHNRLKEKKEIIAKQQGKENPQKGVELA